MKRLMVLTLTAAALSGCAGSQSTLDAITGALEGQQALQPSYVEAYIEFAGPDEKWAGPSAMLVHVVARDEQAEISVTPAIGEFEKTPGPVVVQRSLASKQSRTLSSEKVRMQLDYLAAAAEAPQQAVPGCLSPVKVRLVRADGTVFERRGCRQNVWSHVASRIVSEYLDTVMKAGS